MPFIRISFSKAFEREQTLRAKQELGRLVSILKGKDESKLMLDFRHSPCMFFRGDDLANGAFVDCRLYGPIPNDEKKAFSEGVFAALREIYAIDPADVFIAFTHYDDWGSLGGYKSL
ncbi:MAG: hypothetical protein LUC93_01665 [Planctomycetaceae bacterium]|nr:hypothetical protein [Planctomycetaceae bacterium]